MQISEHGTQILGIVELLFQFLYFIILAYNFVFFIWILSSWLPVNRSILILQFVDNLINPVYYGLLKFLPPLRLGMIDLSPFYMFIFLEVVGFLVQILHNIIIKSFVQLFG